MYLLFCFKIKIVREKRINPGTKEKTKTYGHNDTVIQLNKDKQIKLNNFTEPGESGSINLVNMGV